MKEAFKAKGDKMNEVEKAVNEMRCDEWWKNSNSETYQDLCIELTENGYTLEQAISFLERAYWASASEYGN